MNKSSNHRVWPIGEYELELSQRMKYTCASPRCSEAPRYGCAYDYVTGRSGRVSTSVRSLCLAHAQVFADRNGVQLDFDWEGA